MKQVIIILIFMMLFSVGLFADTDAIMNYRTGSIYVKTEFDLAGEEAQNNDTFPLGTINDTGEWIQTDNDNTIKEYLNLTEPTLKTEKKFYDTEWYVWDIWEFNNESKQIKLYWQWYFPDNPQHKPIDFTLTKYGVKK